MTTGKACALHNETEEESNQPWKQNRLPFRLIYQQNNTCSLELSGDDLTEINTISTGSLMGHKTHLIVGCHNAFGRIELRSDTHVMSATALQRQLAVRDSDKPSWLTVSDSYRGTAQPHQSFPQGQTEVTGAPLTEW